ncbi:MAG: sigma-70 family RNA polymerase sigma factor [Planctomycetes bacterium]|nr:sigma-70 family RNA polymerase sigma factor [Planctomycetota bacterium]MBI3833441.1 sigma-70 family RNA polymerase sigma factor [Planctomycetota bacterium]
MDICEESLTTAAIAGDNTALAQLLERSYSAVVERLAPTIGPSYRSLIDADDVYQVTCIEAFLKIREFRPEGSHAFVGWLTHIAQNNVRDAIRWLNRKKRMSPRKKAPRAHATDSYIGLLAELKGSGTTPIARAMGLELKTLMDDAIAKLPQDYQKVVRMIDLEERTAQEAAEVLGKSSAAVYMLHARAHEHLAKLLGDSTKFFR